MSNDLAGSTESELLEEAIQSYYNLISQSIENWNLKYNSSIKIPTFSDVQDACATAHREIAVHGTYYGIDTEELDYVKLYSYITMHLRGKKDFDSSPLWFAIMGFIQCGYVGHFLAIKMKDIIGTCAVLDNLLSHKDYPQKLACYYYIKGLEDVAIIVESEVSKIKRLKTS